jgi:hypothetical protein
MHGIDEPAAASKRKKFSLGGVHVPELIDRFGCYLWVCAVVVPWTMHAKLATCIFLCGLGRHFPSFLDDWLCRCCWYKAY